MNHIRHALLALYNQLPLTDRIFVRIRLWLSNLNLLELYVPSDGIILDIGCGHGLLSNLLALTSPQRQVIGIDIDPQKITAARCTVGKRTNIDFKVGEAIQVTSSSSYHAITIADVMYLMPPHTQQAILLGIAAALKPNGVMVWKSQIRQPRWKYAITYAQEWVMTKLCFTQGKGLFFMDCEQSLQAIIAAGLHPIVVPMPSIRPYSDILFLGYKKS